MPLKKDRPRASGGTRRPGTTVRPSDAAIFVFVGPHVRATLDRAIRDPTLWRLGLAWRDCIAGRRRLSATPEIAPGTAARLAYDWTADESG